MLLVPWEEGGHGVALHAFAMRKRAGLHALVMYFLGDE